MTPFEGLCERIKRTVPGAATVVATYAGQDEIGTIKDARVIINDPESDKPPGKVPKSLRAEVAGFLHWLLDYHYGDWRYDKGSKGTITIDLSAETVGINHQEWQPVCTPKKELFLSDWQGP